METAVPLFSANHLWQKNHSVVMKKCHTFGHLDTQTHPLKFFTPYLPAEVTP
jgi:hypothetical protein